MIETQGLLHYPFHFYILKYPKKQVMKEKLKKHYHKIINVLLHCLSFFFLMYKFCFTKHQGLPWWSVQWRGACLPTQETWVGSLALEDSTCRRATEPVRHNYWTSTLESGSHNCWAHTLQLLKAMHLELMLHNKRSHHNAPTTKNSPCSVQLEKACTQQWRPKSSPVKILKQTK